MPLTRRSARLADANSSPATASPKAGTKRKADASPSEKKAKKAQKQQTLEEVVPNTGATSKDDVDMKDAHSSIADLTKESNKTDADPESKEGLGINTGDSEQPTDDNSKDQATGGAAEAETESKTAQESEPDAKEKPREDLEPKKEANGYGKVADANSEGAGTKPDAKNVKETTTETSNALVADDAARDDKVASNIIEKGVIYFFTRGRVNIEDPEGVRDLQRTFFVLRPLPRGAKLGHGPIDDSSVNRLLALPKKVFPQSGKDRFMAFVEKAKVSMSELKESFFHGSDYETKTGDKRHTPAVQPVGEGVYAITATGSGRPTAHLCYMLTVPHEPGELQAELGIREKGSFVLSLKNPKNKGPSNAQLPQSPDFPQRIIDDFGGLAWLPVTKSEYLDYAFAQILLVGEGQEKFGGAVEGGEKGEDSPEKELEKLEHEDEIRMESLADDAIFKDLHVSRGDLYPEVKTTW